MNNNLLSVFDNKQSNNNVSSYTLTFQYLSIEDVLTPCAPLSVIIPGKESKGQSFKCEYWNKALIDQGADSCAGLKLF